MKGWKIAAGTEDLAQPSLQHAIRGVGPRRYTDPVEFFARTHITGGLGDALAAIASRMEGVGGPAGLLVYSPSGWGKTHTLIAVYFLASRPGEVSGLPAVSAALRSSGAPMPSRPARVAAFDPTSEGPEDLRSSGWRGLWDFILGSLTDGKVRSSEPPSLETVAEALDLAESESGSAVIIVDGIDVYAAKLKAIGSREALAELEALSAFLESLGAALSSRRRSIAVFSSSSAVVGVGLETTIMSSLRWAKPLTPASPSDVPHICRKSVFEVESQEVASAAASAYMEEYRRASIRAPPGYKEIMESLYPVHPTLAEVLERLAAEASIAWALRLILETASTLEGSGDFILASDVDLSVRRVADAFFTISPRLKAAVLSDVENLKKSGEDLAARLYSAVTLESVGGRSASLAWLLLSAVTPIRGVRREDVERALKTLESEAAHIHVEEGAEPAYRVRSEVNVVVLARRRAREILASRRGEASALVAERIKQLVKAPSTVDVILWPLDPSSVPDSTRLKLVLANPASSEDLGFEAYARRIIENYKAGSWRRHVNTVIVLRPRSMIYERLLEAVAMALAARELASSPRLGAQDRERLRSIEADSLRTLASDAALLYLEAWYPVARESGYTKLAHIQLSPADIAAQGVWAAVRKQLAQLGKLVRKPPAALVELAVRSLSSKEPAGFSKIVEYFTSNPELPMVEAGEAGFEEVLRELLSQGRIGVYAHGKVHCSPPPGGLKALKFAICPSAGGPAEAVEAERAVEEAGELEGRVIVEGSPRAVAALLSMLPETALVRVFVWGLASPGPQPSGKFSASFEGHAIWALRMLQDVTIKNAASKAAAFIEVGSEKESKSLERALEAARRLDPELEVRRSGTPSG